MAEGSPVPFPSAGFDPQISLATAVNAGPGVFALLLGSGVSSTAGISTGWQIVTDLVGQAVAASKTPQALVALSPDEWWAEHGDGMPLGYSGLLSALSPTDGGRDLLLRKYFEPTADDQATGQKLPTQAHRAIAELVSRGLIRVILTTNFDRLMEQALEQRGISPQVVHRPEQIAGMTPLSHSAITVIKLHGDYADLDKRNTVDELETYPEALDTLLRRVLDEYGLVVCGWSGEWDTALVRAVEETGGRRYPRFWSSYSDPTQAAARMISQLGAVRIDPIGADQLFTGLRNRLDALARMSSTPPTSDIAVARLKRSLPDPARRIDLHDVVMGEVDHLARRLGDRQRYPLMLDQSNWVAEYDSRLAQCRADADTLLRLLAAGGYFGTSAQQGLWTAVMQRLLDLQRMPTSFSSSYQPPLLALLHYPALLASDVLIATSTAAGRPELLGSVLLKPRYTAPSVVGSQPCAYWTSPARVLLGDVVNALPRWGGQSSRWVFPQSHLLRQDLDDVLATYEPDEYRRGRMLNQTEYLTAAVRSLAGDRPYLGEFVYENRHGDGPGESLGAARAIVEDMAAGSLATFIDNDSGRVREVLDNLDGEIARARDRAW